MSFVHVIHRDNRPWPRPRNHYDSRVCPDCGTTVHGQQAQSKHRNWHLRLNTLMTQLANRTGLTEEDYEVPWRWGTAAGGHISGNSEIEEAGEG
jgi:hypothetical protein